MFNNRGVRVRGYQPKAQTKERELVATEHPLVPDIDETPEIAEPTEDNSEDPYDHWADVVVTAESDEETKTETQELTCKPKTSRKEWYTCKLCVYQSLEVGLLLKHMMRKHTYMEEFYTCGFCKYQCKDEEILEHHLKEHIPKKQVVDDYWKCYNRYDVWRWTKEEKAILEEVFKKQHYLERETKLQLVKRFKVDAEKIQAWFKNRRILERKQRS